MELTKKEQEIVKHCEDFCPFAQAVVVFNRSHKHKFLCPDEMCERITEAYIRSLRGEPS